MEKRDIWIQNMKDWKESGLKRVDYCRQNQIRLSSFDYWKRKIGEKNPNSEMKLVNLPILLNPPKPIIYTFEYPTGHKVYIPENYSSDSLKNLISNINEALR